MRTYKTILVPGIILTFSLAFTFCQHEDQEIIPVKGPDPVVRGTETLSCTNCTPLVENGASSDFSSSGVPSNQWYFDKAHSSVIWETAYKGVSAVLVGRFTYFVLKNINFDEANPSSISFEAYVRLNSVNTGEPGRDGACLLDTYGTAVGKTAEPENIATLKSTSVEYSQTDEGYIVKANLTFRGITKEIIGKMYYSKQLVDAAGTLAGLSCKFDMLAKTDFTVESNNIDDKVSVTINANLKKKP